MPEISDLISFITSPSFSGWLLVIKIVFILAFLLFLFGIFYFATRSSWGKNIFFQDAAEIFTYRPYGVRKIVKQWTNIVVRLETGLESEYKLAVIEADSLLDGILKRMGFAGATLGERLEKLTAATLPNIDQVWEAHKIRNNIVHDPDYRLSLEEARRVIAIYEKALTDLQAL